MPLPPLTKLPRPARNGVLLLDHLVAAYPSLSRRAAKALIDDRLVFVNGRRIWMARHPLQTRDVVEILSSALPRPSSSRASAAPRATAPIRILLDGPAFLVADKPPNLLSVGDRSLETRLRDQLSLPAIRAVHRLDKDTTGAILFSKTPEARDALVAQFEATSVKKLYHAIVAGSLPEPLLEIDTPIDRLPALSRVRLLSAVRRPYPAAHVAVSIETGRTHQIRIHLHSVGCPVLGDRHYFTPLSARAREVPRPMLHAATLRFLHPVTNTPLSVSSPLPRDFLATLRLLRLT